MVPSKFFKINDEIDCVITDIDKEKKRIAISHKLAKENPYQKFAEKIFCRTQLLKVRFQILKIFNLCEY